MPSSSEINIDNDQPAIVRIFSKTIIFLTPLINLLKDQFGIAKFKDSDSDINFYTGFPNYQTLVTCYNFLNPGENGENIVYNTSANDNLTFPTPNSNNQENPGNKPGRRRKLSSLDEFFMVLVRMKLGLFELDLAHRFGSSCLDS